MISRLRSQILLVAMMVLLLINIGIGLTLVHSAEKVLTVSFLNVGQGDAIFIETPHGNQMIIDAGRDTTVLRELGKSMGFFDRTIDLVLMTHPDLDHIGGFPEIFDRYRVAHTVENGNRVEKGIFDAVEERIRNEKGQSVVAKRGMKIILDDGIYFEVLFPDRDTTGWETNQSSIVGKLVFGKTSVLLTGDAPVATESYLVALDPTQLDSDVLKLGHHGSRTSTSEAFLSAVSPSFAVISAGKDNEYGHPHREVTDMVRASGATMLGTYDLGRVVFVSDGERIWQK